MKRRILASLLAAGMCVSLFAGCSLGGDDSDGDTSKTSGSSSDGTVNLTVWGAEEDAELLETLISGFKQEYSDTSFNITVEAVAESDCKNTLLSDVLNAPDVFAFADDQLSSLVASGVMSPVENADEVSSANSSGSVEAATVNGTLYAYPMTADNGYFLFYDKSYFTDEDLTTLDGILSVCASNGKYFFFDFTSGWYVYSFFAQTGLTVGLNDDGISNYCTWNSTENAITGQDVANAMIAIAQSGGLYNTLDADGNLANSLTGGAADGTIIAGVSGVWDSSALQETWGENYGAMKLPTYTVAGQQVQMSSFAGYKMIGVNKYSENVEWAHKLADYLTNEDSQNTRFAMRSLGPSNTNAASTAEVQSALAIQALIAQSEYATLQRIGNNYWSPVATFGKSMFLGNPSGADVQEQLDTMVEEVTASNS